MSSLKRKRTTLMPAVAMAALGAVVAIPALSSPRLYAASPEHFRTVIVQRGDSLWALAAKDTPADGSVQETIDRIMAFNHLENATVVPGQHLEIPN